MLETPHVIVGAAIATKVVHPALAIPLALASHFLLDAIPHWNPHLNSETNKLGKPTKRTTTIVITDVLVSLGAGFLITFRFLPDVRHAALVIICCFAAVLPDVVEGPYFFLGKRNEIIKKWISMHKAIQSDTSFLLGTATQVFVVGASLWWIFT